MYRRRFQPLRMWVAIISSRDVKVTRRKKTGEQKNQRRTYSKSPTVPNSTKPPIPTSDRPGPADMGIGGLVELGTVGDLL